MNRTGRLESSTQLVTLLSAAALLLTVAIGGAAIPYTRATVTRTQNKVTYGEAAGPKARTRPASTGDIVKADNYVLTETESRAELQYDDGSVVRIGQNTVFSFEADSRTLTLKEGTFIFFVPRGQGGTIKTPSLTAAITGTAGKVSRDTIAVLEGEVTLIPSGRKVRAGEFARRMPDGSIFIARFNPATAPDGVLMAFNGPMPGFSEDRLLPGRRLALAMPDTSFFDMLDRTQNNPAALSRTRIFVPPPSGGGGGNGGPPALMMRASSWMFLPVLLVAAAGQLRNAKAGTVSTSQTAKEIEDIGVIEAANPDDAQGKPQFRASAQVRGEFSTNAKLTGNHSSGDLIFFPQVEVGFNVPMKHNFSFDVAAKLESGIYTDHEDRGFIGYSLISTLDWRPKVNWPRIYVGAEPYRYDSFDTGDKITEAIGLTAGTDWGYAFNKGYSMAFVGYSFSSYYADPSIDDRGQHRAIVGVSHQFGNRVVGSLFYQFSYSDFHNVERRDFRNLVGATATYQFTRGLFGVFTTSFVDNDSSQDFASYQSFNLSLGVNVQF